MTYRIPRRFYDDHAARDLPSGTITRSTKTHHHVELNNDDHAELLSDARHYADASNGWSPELFGLCASARATVKALTATR